MATPYSQDLRDRVLAAYDRGLPTQQIAQTFQVSKAWARRIKQRRRETGETSARAAWADRA
jgi:transposase